MPGKVFISCGQNYPDERATTAELSQSLRDRGFFPYVAIQAQSIQDVNTAIISELRASDYYIFIDFPRELLQDDSASAQEDDSEGAHRGSLFTHQELAIAYILGFERVLFLRHKDVKVEGLLQYMASNAIVFSSSKEVTEKVEEAINERGWMPSYTRHLIAANLRWSPGIMRYRSHSTGETFEGKFLYIDIQNNRRDLAANNTVARLDSINDSNGNSIPIADLSHLKVTGQPAYAQTIWPESHGAFDLLLAKAEQEGTICLNSSLDLTPKPPIITQPGRYILCYGVLSESFPVLKFCIQLEVTGDALTTEAQLIDG
jgi:hypothetical protein